MHQTGSEISKPDFEYFFNQAQTPFAILTGEDLMFTFANPAYVALLNGRKLVGKKLLEAIPELKDQPFLKLLQDVYETGIPFHTPEIEAFAVYRGDTAPTKRYFSLSYTPYKDDNGVTQGILAAGYDITEQVILRKAQEKLKLNYQAYNLFMQAPFPITIYKGYDLVLELANEAALKIADKNRDILGRPILEIIPELEGNGFVQVAKKVMRTGMPFHASESPLILNVDGKRELFYLNYAVQPFYEENDVISGVMVTSNDVTEQVLARKKIEKAEERARLAIEAAGMGVFDVNLIDNIVENSTRLNEIFDIGHSNERERYISAIHPDDLGQREQAYKKAYETGVLKYEARIILKNNATRWIRANGKIFFNEKGIPAHLHGVVQDITEQKQFAQELEKQVAERTEELNKTNELLTKTNAELEQYAHVSSHDLQEPLRKILMFTSLIKDKDYENLSDPSKVRFDKIVDSTNRMSKSLKDLLNFTSLSKEEQFAIVDLNEVLRSVESDLELVIANKQATITAGKLPSIRAISLQMHQLFYNLVNNALKFSRPGVDPVISITAVPLADTRKPLYKEINPQLEYYEISIKDNGIGFDQLYADKIFTIFQRLHHNNKFSGTGIGLALCKKVAVNHNGQIFAESVPNEGATFYIALPG